jgi:hypothetical protein
MKNDSPQADKLSEKMVTLKTDDEDFKKQLLLLIDKTNQLRVITNNPNELVIASMVTDKTVSQMFPNIKAIKKKRFAKYASRSPQIQCCSKYDSQDIVSISGVLVKKR